jgi:hypothetical protein
VILVDVTRIDALVRSLSAPSSRRGLLRGASATALALAATRLPADAEARNKKKKKGKKRGKKQDSTPQTPTSPQDPTSPPPYTPVTKTDAVCPGPSDTAFGIIDVNARLAQTFTAIASGPLVRAELRLTEPAGSTGDYVLRLSPIDPAGIPTNVVLAETQVADGNVPNGQSTVTFDFANPASVEAGTSYALVVTRPGSNQLVWVGKTGNACSGTAFMSPSQDAAFIAVGNIDFTFTTYVTS